jgi:hypothetical protein
VGKEKDMGKCNRNHLSCVKEGAKYDGYLNITKINIFIRNVLAVKRMFILKLYSLLKPL